MASRLVAEKASRAVASLGRLIVNVRALRFSKRRLLISLINSVLPNEVEVWAHVLRKNHHSNELLRVQGRVPCKSLRLSEVAIISIVGIVPIHLLVRDSQSIYCRSVRGTDKLLLPNSEPTPRPTARPAGRQR